MTSSTSSRDEHGDVNFLMVEFPAGTPPFNGNMAAELMRLHDVGLIRVLDLLVILKDSNGGVRGCEATGLDGPDLRRLGSELPRILAAIDVSKLAEALEPDTTAGVIVWANTWAVPLVTAVRSAGGEPVAAGSIAASALAANAGQIRGEADRGPLGHRGTWEPLSAARHQAGGLLGAVTRTRSAKRQQA
jgi:hypothetical protein